jgi:protein-S-isoprenylcysteine O-methyltransferase Ste14
VLVILSLVIQVLLDATRLNEATRWVARVTAPLAALLVSGGFFGVAFHPAFGALLWLGAACLLVTVVITGVGLVRTPVRIETGKGGES